MHINIYSRASSSFRDSQDLLQKEKSLKHSYSNRQQFQPGCLSTGTSRLLSASLRSKTTSSMGPSLNSGTATVRKALEIPLKAL